VRIAVTGSHRTGKSTLIADLVEMLPGFAAVPEPYELLEEEGWESGETPTLEDYERQLARSLDLLADDRQDAIFERCPLDFVGYALCCPDGESFDAQDWLPRIRPAMASLSLVVFVPVEDPDRIALPPSEDRGFRLLVDERLREIVRDDSFGLDLEVVEVSGSRRRRADTVIARIRDARASPGASRR